MDNCILRNYKYDKARKAIPLVIRNEPIRAIRLQDFVVHEEIVKLNEYTEMLFKNLDNNRRKKVARLNNLKAAKSICKRLRFKEINLGGEFIFDSYCPEIEIVKWVKDKSLCNIDIDKLLGERYIGDEAIQYCTFAISISPPSSHSTLTLRDDPDSFVDVVLRDRISLFFHNGSLKLSEVMSAIDRTHIFFHIRYISKIHVLKDNLSLRKDNLSLKKEEHLELRD